MRGSQEILWLAWHEQATTATNSVCCLCGCETKQLDGATPHAKVVAGYDVIDLGDACGQCANLIGNMRERMKSYASRLHQQADRLLELADTRTVSEVSSEDYWQQRRLSEHGSANEWGDHTQQVLRYSGWLPNVREYDERAEIVAEQRRIRDIGKEAE